MKYRLALLSCLILSGLSAQVITILGTDVVSASRTTINNNFSFLDTHVLGVAGVRNTVAEQVLVTSGVGAGAWFAIPNCPDATGAHLNYDTSNPVRWVCGTTGIWSLNGLNGAIQSFVNDTNVTVVSSGTTHTITWAGFLSQARGGGGADFSATGGANQVVRQSTVGGAFTVSQLASGNLSDVANILLSSANLTYGAFTSTFAAAAHSTPWQVGTLGAIPATCSVGEAYFASNALAGQQIYECDSLNHWTQQLNTGVIASLNGLTASAQTFTNDTNVTIVSGGTAHVITWAGLLGVARGGSGANLSATGGANQVVRQSSVGGAFTVSQLATANLSDVANILFSNTSFAFGAFTADFSGAAHTSPWKVGSLGALPGTCTIGEGYFATNAVIGQMVYECSATNTWTQESGGISSLNALTAASQTFTNDANVTIVSGGTAHVITWAGLLSVARGGSGANLSATGGANQVVQQSTVGGPFTVSQLASANLSDAANILFSNTNLTYGAFTSTFAAAAHSTPWKVGVLASLPGTCAIGEAYFATNATAGQMIYECDTLNHWTQQLNSGGIVSINGLVASSQTFVNDTNVTLVSAGSTHTFTWAGVLGVARGGGGASFAATGGSNQVVQQSGVGAAFTVSQLSSANLSDVANILFKNVNFVFSSNTADFSQSAHSTPWKVGTLAQKPISCAVGEAYFATDATPGQMIYECSTANTWIQQLAGGAGNLSIFTNGSFTGTRPAVNFATGTGITQSCADNPALNRVDCTPSVNTAVILSIKGAAQSGVPLACNSTTGNVAYTCTLAGTGSAMLTAYTARMQLLLVANATCTAACALNIDGLGNISIKQIDGVTDPGGQIVAGQPYILEYDGTVFRLVTAGASSGGGITSFNGLTTASQTFTNDTNVTIVSGAGAHVITWAGLLSVARGGSGANLSATGGANQVVQQSTVGGPFTVSQLASANLSDAANILFSNTNLTYGAFTSTFAAAAHSTPWKVGVLASLPGTCAIGEAYFATNATAGQMIYECDTLNHWTQQLNSGGIVSINGLVASSQTFVNDTNVTLVSAGSTHTFTWAGVLGVARGGGGASFAATGGSNQVVQQSGVGAAFTVSQLSSANLSDVANILFKNVNFVFSSNTADFSQSAHSTPWKVGTLAQKPISCAVGEAYFATDATPGQMIYECSTANTWIQQLAGGAGNLSIFTNGSFTGTRPAVNFATGTGITQSCADNPALNRVDCTPSVNTAVILSIKAAQSGVPLACNSTTGNVAYTCTLAGTGSAMLTAYTARMQLLLVANATCTAACALNIDGLGNISIKQIDGVTDPGGQIVAGQPYILEYDGTVFRLVTAGASSGGGITSFNGLTTASQTFTNDTNVTIVSGAGAHVITWAGLLSVARGGTNANLSATGGANQVVRQSTVGGAFTVSQLATANLSDVANILFSNTNLTYGAFTSTFAGAAHSTPWKVGVLASLPGTCAIGEAYFATNATAGQMIYECDTLNHWTQQLNSGGIVSINGLVASSQTFVNDTNVTLVSAGSTHTFTWAGVLGVARGGGGASFAATGGSNQVVQQSGVGAAFTVSQLSSANLSDVANILFKNVNFVFSSNTADFSQSAHSTPWKVGTLAQKPISCAVGEAYFATDATPGQMIYECSTANTWIQQLAGGAGNLSIFTNGSFTGTRPAVNFATGTGITQSCADNPALNRVDCTPSVNTAVILSIKAAQSGVPLACNSTTGNVAYTCTLAGTGSAMLTAYTAGMQLLLVADATCTTSCALNIDGVGNISIKQIDGTTDPGGQIVAGQPNIIEYDGTVFRLIGAGGSGTVNSGTASHLGYYPGTGTSISDMGADLTFNTHTLSGGASAIVDLNAASAFRLPSSAGNPGSNLGECKINTTTTFFTCYDGTASRQYLTAGGTQVVGSKTLTSSNLYADSSDNTKAVQFVLSGLTTGTTRNITWPNAGGAVAGTLPLVVSMQVPATQDVICALHTDTISGITCANGADATSDTAFATGFTVPANFMQNKKNLRVTGSFAVWSGSAAVQWTWKLKAGATTIYSSKAPITGLANSITNQSFVWSWDMVAAAAPSASSNTFTADSFPNVPGVAGAQLVNITAQPVLLNTSGSLALTLTISYAANTAANAVQLQWLRVEEIN